MAKKYTMAIVPGEVCGGCDMAIVDLHEKLLEVLGNVEIVFWPIATDFKEEDIERLEQIDIALFQGSIRTEKHKELVEMVAKKAKIKIAFGACACFGGIPSGKPNPTGAMGLRDFLKEVGVNKPVINLPCCPGHPDHLVITLASVMLGVIPSLDEHGRPLMFFGKNMHDELCPYRPYYDRGIFATKPGEEGCRFKLGCKGPIVHTDCAIRKWNNHVSYCVEVGAPCIGCAEPGFPDKFSPFYKELPGLPTVLGIDATKLGEGLIGATALGIGIHLVRRAIGKGGKEEEKK